MRILVTYRQNQGPGQGWETGAALVRALRRLGHDAYPYGTVYQTSQPMADEAPWTPELILFCECGDGDRQYIEFAARSCPMAMWLFDTGRSEDYRAHHKELIDHFKPELLFLANLDELAFFPEAHYLPYGVDETQFKPTGATKFGAAIIGSAFEKRARFAEAIGVEVRQTQTGQRYVDEISKLNVHVHHTNSGGAGLLVMRYWETLATGTLLLCPSDAAVKRHFKDGVHLVTYSKTRHHSEVRDCQRRLRILLSDPCKNLRQRIAEDGRAAILAAHTYRHRAEEILSYL